MTTCTYKGSAVHNSAYRINGTGRDTYVYNNNGGLDHEYHPVNYAKPGKFMSSQKNFYKPRNPTIQSKAVLYKSDGSGRDSYVVTSSGGFSNPSKLVNFKKAFVNSLREYNRPQTSYVKRGGQSVGMQRTASPNTYASKESLCERKDQAIAAQLTFDPKFMVAQKRLRNN
jgi:hypothetical protein